MHSSTLKIPAKLTFALYGKDAFGSREKPHPTPHWLCLCSGCSWLHSVKFSLRTDTHIIYEFPLPDCVGRFSPQLQSVDRSVMLCDKTRVNNPRAVLSSGSEDLSTASLIRWPPWRAILRR